MAINWSLVGRLAKAHHLEDAAKSEETLSRFLRAWWCFTYNRPFKDPLLDTYTTDELAYEYLRHWYADPKNDPALRAAEQAREKDDEEWARKMAQQAAQAAAQPPKPPETPAPPPPSPPDITTTFE